MDLQVAAAWGGFAAVVVALLLVDLLLLHRKPHQIDLREALVGAAIPAAAALLFMIAIYWAYETHVLHLGILPQGVSPDDKYYADTGFEAAVLFLTGYVVELSLSADNVFLFVLLMGFFKVPKALEHRVLFWGVIGALVMRAVMIVAAGVLLAAAHWVIYVFGAFLLYTGIKMFFSRQEEGKDPSNTVAVRLAKSVFPIYDGYDGKNFFTQRNGRRFATTLFLVLVCIEFTDLVFALDSIPAIFGITRDAFIVFTSNVFAILGLRSMYFLLAGVMDRFHLLKLGLAFVLAFVGVKMILPLVGHLWGLAFGGDHAWEVDKFVSLGVILGALVISVVGSLIVPAKKSTVVKQAST